MIPVRSTRAKAALDIFFDGHNDVHFYVEDTDQRNLYKVILGRLFPRLSISQIFPLDGKPNVLAHARDTDANSSVKKPRVYIVDKDFDDLLGAKEKLPNLFYLKRYCIENYLLDEDAAIGFVIDVAPKTDRDRLQAALRYEKYLEETVTAVDPLFRLFFLVQKYALGLQNAHQPPERFTANQHRGKIDPAKVTTYRRQVAQALIAQRVIRVDADLDKLCTKAFPKNRAPDVHISGKFLMKLVYLHLRYNKHVGNVESDVMLFALARNSTNTSLRELRTRIRRYLRSIPYISQAETSNTELNPTAPRAAG